MTVNKSQGQSLEKVGVDLRSDAFTHGQLDVALSRVTSLDGLTLLPSSNSSNTTANIVYPDVLQGLYDRKSPLSLNVCGLFANIFDVFIVIYLYCCTDIL